jgi:hypothetical protein
MKQAIERGQIKTVDDFFPFIDRCYSFIPKEYIPEMSRYFLNRLSPSIAEANQFIRKFSPMSPITYSEIKEYEVRRAQSIGDFFDAADPVNKEVLSTQLLPGIIRRHWPSFVSLKPTLADVNFLLKMYPGLLHGDHIRRIEQYIRAQVAPFQSV